MSFRIGLGNDLHLLVENRDFLLGGVKIPFEKGFKAHSDGDVLIHAIIDAILGALAFGDIGSHFPDNDEKYKNMNSAILLNEVLDIMKSKGFEIVNIDTIINAQKPKLQNYIPNIRQNLSKLINIDINNISIKAKTGEGIGIIGESKAVKVECVVLLSDKINE